MPAFEGARRPVLLGNDSRRDASATVRVTEIKRGVFEFVGIEGCRAIFRVGRPFRLTHGRLFGILRTFLQLRDECSCQHGLRIENQLLEIFQGDQSARRQQLAADGFVNRAP